jgi:hypothetical protein
MLDSWPELSACNQELINGVLHRELIFEPFHEEDEQPTPDAIQRMKLCSSALRQMRPDTSRDENGIHGTLRDILSGWLMGQVVLEVNWDKEPGSEELNIIQAGKLGDITAPRSTFWVHPVCYGWDMTGSIGLRGEVQALQENTRQALKWDRGQGAMAPSLFNSVSWEPRPMTIQPFPENKFLIGLCKHKSGTALSGARLRALAWWWCAANFTSDWLLNLAQLFGIPFRWVEYDPMMPAPLKAELDNMLQNMGSAGYGRFPTGVKLNFIEGGKGSEHSPQANLLDRADRYARLIVLGQTLTGNTGSGKGGGLAFGKMEAQVKDVMMEAAGEYACSVINNQLIPALLRLNYDDDSARPTMRLLDKEEGTPDDAKRDTTLAAAGLKIGVNFLRKKYGIPAPEVGEETIGPDTMAKEPQTNGGSTEGNKGNKGAEDGADLSAALKGTRGTKGTSGSDKDILLEALRTEFESLNKRLEAIANISDPQVQKAKLNSVLLELDKFEADLHHDPEVARAIYKILVQGVGNGMAEAAQERT